MPVTPSGRMTEVRDEQPENVPLPIPVTLSGRMTEERNVQSLNA